MSNDLGDSGSRKIVNSVNPNRAVELDNIYRAILGITVAHHAVHEGISFMSSVVGAENLSLAFKVPAGLKIPHLIATLVAEDEATMDIYEGRTWATDTGGVHPVYNRARASANASILEENKSATPDWTAGNILLNPTGQSGGTILDTVQTWSGKQQTFESRGTEEIDFKADETYVVVASTGATKGIQIKLDWYEKAPE